MKRDRFASAAPVCSARKPSTSPWRRKTPLIPLGEAWEKTEAPRGRLDQWYEDPENLLYCGRERASKTGPSSLDEAPAGENPAEDQEEYDDVALVEAW
jgi:hypothetical protein